ncbi:NAD(P)-dependent nickel-iron dehydrogenase catalytic subunit [Lutibacter agarilyticus]|uniref:NAD(P)-dependent nickel-iron dehydrogenase catalytic subunit n=1 Tax=Lutibacter agarilyticus TaxID=1109740 RepID=A0A238YWZ5_9FLAO|nr:Ni/Fe hydrogenase subunit alpha [Lutibacter agarilyticus]SNR75627.1 NAD(P)-dependent nickel-iron dehydrogenase catalytic subunit [Lutibacter agarilyticus]
MNKRKITIEPITRVEGHGKVTIKLDENGKVEDAFLHIVEFRGFEKFIQGHPYWEAPVLVQRLCGICPVSHHLAAAKAIDQLVGVDPENLSPTATKLRRLLHYGQVFQSHSLHFFYLASPDILFGINAPAEKRNIVAVAAHNKELAKKGILMRKFGQEIIKALAGKKIHGIVAVPGGVYKTFTKEERAYFLDGKQIPNVDTMIEWSKEIIDFIKNYHTENAEWIDNFASYPSNHLGLVDRETGALELYDGRLRSVNSEGKELLNIEDIDYRDHFKEAVAPWSYLKFPYMTKYGREEGWNRVGPLARMNTCSHITTPLAEIERLIFKGYTNNQPNNMTMHTHWARLIEMLHCAELMKELLLDEEIMGSDLVREGTPRNKGIGIIEAPRGTLIHEYHTDDKGLITKCNLIVSTTHNNEAMNRGVRAVASQILSEKPEITEPMLNQVEIAIRAYDPCLSCATHALGQMPLIVQLEDNQGNLIDEKIR